MTPTAMIAVGVLLNPPRGGFFVARIAKRLESCVRAVIGMDKAKSGKIVEVDRIRQPATSGNLARRLPQGYYSILFESPADRVVDDALPAPGFFIDLNCHQLVDAVTAGKEEYNLKPFFHACLRRVEAIKYRHEIMQDLENAALLERVRTFAQKLHDVRERLSRSQKLYYKEHKQAWFLATIESYCDTITAFATDLSRVEVKSRGFSGFRDFLSDYAGSARFNALLSETDEVNSALARVEYCVLISGDKFTVRKYQSEPNYSVEVEETFEKFKQGAVRDYKVKFSESDDMNHIEAKILAFVAKLYPDVFESLDQYCAQNVSFLDDTISTFDREIQFYLAYIDYTAALKQAGLQFCYPRVSDKNKEVYDYDGFDIVLAKKLTQQHAPIICNDLFLEGRERVLVISGPNQGGKTTFARAFGQLHYLASIGCPVPGREAQLFVFDKLFTHFEKEEKVENLRGKLEDDLLRIQGILDHATSRSIIIMNEVFTSTTVQDETFLSKKVMERIRDLGLLCVWVTFVDELASFGPQTVSMVSTIFPDNPALRTFKIVRQPADGLAYAMAIAQKYGLTYDAIKERIKR